MSDDRVREVALSYFEFGAFSNNLVKYFTDEKEFLEQAQETLMKLMQGGQLTDQEAFTVSTTQEFTYQDLSFEQYFSQANRNKFTDCISKLYKRPVEEEKVVEQPQVTQ